MIHMYTCRQLIMFFDVSRFSLDGSSPAEIRSAWDQGAKVPEAFCGGKSVFSLGLGLCLFVALYYLSTAGQYRCA